MLQHNFRSERPVFFLSMLMLMVLNPGSQGFGYPGTTVIDSVTWQAEVTIQDGYGNHVALALGQAPGASNGLDAGLGEEELPPLPPSGVFDARFDVSGTQGSLIDFRNDAVAEPIWIIKFQRSLNGGTVSLSWNAQSFPDGSFTLLDPFGGVVANVDMKKQSSFSLSNANVTTLFIKHTNEIDVLVQAGSGWNMISVPLLAADMRVQALFQESAASSAFTYDNGFVPVSTLENGVGYWLKFSGQGSFSLSGYPVDIQEIPLNAGWNMIGGFEQNVDVALISSEPPGLIISDFFGFEKGYQLATSLAPAKGYWVKASQAGKLILKNGQAKRLTSHVNRPKLAWPRLEFTDAADNRGYLYFATGYTRQAFELPPVPPNGIFDVRFDNDRMVTPTNSPCGTIALQASSYPIRIVARNFTGRRLRIRDALSGKIMNATLRDGDTLHISQPIGKLRIALQDEAGMPEKFALRQAYPNPFNPATTVTFSIPEEGRVTLTLFDALGRVVAAPLDRSLRAGEHTLRFEAGELPSGVYFLQLRAGKLLATRKILLSK